MAKKTLDQGQNEFTRDSVIYCVELSWKTSKKIMGTSASAPKQVVREMVQSKLIDDVSIWLQSIDERNLSSYTYNEDLAERVYSFVENFYPNFERLVARLKEFES